MKKNKAVHSSADKAYGAVVYWITFSSALLCIVGPLAALALPGRNVLEPGLVFEGVWEGRTAGEVWLYAGGGFPGGHFYIDRLFSGDGLTYFGIVLGSTAALWGLLAAAACFIRERAYGYAGACVLVSAVIVFAMTGVVSLK